MRNIHPAAWAGLFLNLCLAWMLFAALGAIDTSLLGPEDREAVLGLMEAVEGVKPFFYGLLAAQAVALGLIASRLPFGLPVAIFSSIFMLPASLLYLLGTLLTHYGIKHAGFLPAPADYTGARAVFPAFAARRMKVFAATGFGFFLLLFLAGSSGVFPLPGWLDLAFVFLGAGLAGGYCALRAARHHALSIHDEYFTVTPGLFSGRLLLPYADVRLATLYGDETIHFEVEKARTGVAGWPSRTAQQPEREPDGSEGDRRGILVWSLKTVEPAQRRQALETLGAALDAHNVPLQ